MIDKYSFKDICKLVLSRDGIIEDIFYNGTNKDIKDLCNCILNYEIDDYIKSVKSLGNNFDSSDIPIYSSFDEIYNILNYLMFKEDGLNFNEIGKKLYGSKTDFARKKYGENHSKLAKEVYFVRLVRKKEFIVYITNLGKLIARDTIKEKDKLISILFLGNPLIQTIISDVQKKDIKYIDYVSNLSYKSQLRRRSNVKKIVEFIFDKSEYLKKCKYSIDWNV